MLHASLTFDPSFVVGEVNPRLFGSFVEHLGRCVYTGLYEPDHPAADADGLRTDVLSLVRELGVTVVRYPGGNFVSGYRWEDGVGPRDQRPRRLDLAWRSLETNQFGLGEFMRFVRKVDAEPMLAVNLGTRGVQEACDLLEYANFPGGTTLSDLRRAHGDDEPYGIKLWCLGNEMDGPWQLGHRPAADYGRLAVRAARAMHMMEDGLGLVACGSSGFSMSTFGSWEREVLQETYESVDYISCHSYYEERDGDAASFLATATDMERYIEAVVATCDQVGAQRGSRKRINISFDEWNVWYMNRPSPHAREEWAVAPRLLEDVYTVTDAVVVGSLLITLLRHSDRVTAACQAQLVNVIGPIMTEPGGAAWRQTIFHPFAQASRHGRGTVLQTVLDTPTHTTAAYGDVPTLHATAVLAADGTVTVFAVNRDLTQPMRLTINAPGWRVTSHTVLADPDRHATNTAAAPDRVIPRAHDGDLPALSWNVIQLARD